MIDFSASVSSIPHECQIVTELPAGGGDKGGLGGSSVGVISGVPPTDVGVAGWVAVLPGWVAGVPDRFGVAVGRAVDVAGPGYGRGVLVIRGNGYGF